MSDVPYPHPRDRAVPTATPILGAALASFGVACAAATAAGPGPDGDWIWSGGRLDPESTLIPVLDASTRTVENLPELGAFVRRDAGGRGDRDLVGAGGVDMRWRLDELLDVAVVVGAALETDPLDEDAWSTRNLAGRSTAFDGMDFGGRSARDATPFDPGAALARRADRDGLDASFLAARAAFRPGRDTRIGMIATASGDAAGLGLVGVDVAQRIAGHEIRGWIQQRTGVVDAAEESDRSAFGASIGGRFESIRYEVDWRRIGDGFESDLGSVRGIGSQSFGGRLGWGVDLGESTFLRRVDLGVRGRFESDLDLLERRVDVGLDALTLTTAWGDRFTFGVDQSEASVAETSVASSSEVTVGWISSDRLPIQIGNELRIADRDLDSRTTWRTRTRWRAGHAVSITGDLDWSRSDVQDGRRESHFRTSLGADVGVDARTVARASIVVDSATSICSLRQSIGWRMGDRSEVDLAIEQRLPTGAVDRGGEVRARIGGRITF